MEILYTLCNPSERAGARHDNAVQHAQPDVLRWQHRLGRREVRDLQVVHDERVTRAPPVCVTMRLRVRRDLRVRKRVRFTVRVALALALALALAVAQTLTLALIGRPAPIGQI